MMSAFELPEPVDDGMFIPEVRPWSRAKHHFLRRYLDAFTVSMRKKRWDGLHYIDLFAGAGIERVVEDGATAGLDWGSPLVAAQLPVQFDQLHLAELDKKKFQALVTRLNRFQHSRSPQTVAGNANEVVVQILASIPQKALSVAFLDPYGLHLHFETLRKLGSRRVDLIVFFPDHVDALRNWEIIYHDDLQSNLDLVLGTTRWRGEKMRTPPDGWADMLSRIYVDQIKSIGYTEFEYERIKRTDGRPLYKLIYCCRSSIGAGIWRGVASLKPDGQNSFGF